MPSPSQTAHRSGDGGETLLALHRAMVRIRAFEERTALLLEAGEVRCPVHLCTGQEAVAVGVCAAIGPGDPAFGNHRSHGHYLAKGGDLDALMAELYCRLDGCSGGRGGSMHLIDTAVRFLGTVPIVAGTIPAAVGAALSARLRRSEEVVTAFFGDSATEEGVFHEALNFAVLHRLPVLFVCENNGFSSHLRLERRRTFHELVRLVQGYGILAERLDGNDVLAVRDAARRAVDHARAGAGPTFLECITYRWRGHVGPSFDIDVGIRGREEVEAWKERCPIRRFEARLLSDGTSSRAELAEVWRAAEQEVERAVGRARDSPAPAPGAVTAHVFREVP